MKPRPSTLQELRRDILAAALLFAVVLFGAWAWVDLLTALH
jgi:hypothetical protein